MCVQVLYRKQGHSLGTLYTTSRLYIDLPLPAKGDYVVEVRAHTEGGDGAVAQIQITGNKGHLYRLQRNGSPALGSENVYLLSCCWTFLLLGPAGTLAGFICHSRCQEWEPSCRSGFNTPDWRANFTAVTKASTAPGVKPLLADGLVGRAGRGGLKPL